MHHNNPTTSLSALGLLIVVTSVLAFGGAHLSDAAVVGLYALLFAPWAALLWLSGRQRLDWRWLVGAAVLVRLLFLFAPPLLSDDIFRYVWDGRVAAHGVNPFVYAPASEALRALRDAEIWAHINHRQVPTIYPPVAQMLFELNAWLGGATRLLRGLLVLVEAAGVAGVWFILKGHVDSTRLQRAFATYALCPLVVVETAWSGHVDVLAWTPLVLAALLLGRATSLRGVVGAGALLGLSIGAKFLGLLAIPLVLLAPRGENEATFADAARRRVAFVATAAAVVAVAYLPYVDAGPRLFAGFGTYASRWEANDGPFRAASRLSEASLEAWAPAESNGHIERVDGKLIFRYPEHNDFFRKMGWTRPWRGRQVPATSFASNQIAHSVAKATAAFVLGLALLWAAFVRRELLGALLAVLLALFFVAPVVHPWYVAWLVPLAALRRSRTALVFSFVVLAAYLAWMGARAGDVWQVPGWVLAVEFGVVAVVWFWEAASGGDCRPATPSASR